MTPRNREVIAMTPTQAIGKLIRTRREKLGMNQTDLGKLLDLHQAAVCRVEKGQQHLTFEQGLLATALLKLDLRMVRKQIIAMREGA